ncbi:hypothetical protein AADZ86_00815 [Colwelliaceae bacterium BS250]
MKYNLKVTLYKEEIQKCIDFGKRFADIKNQKSSLDFGSNAVIKRDITDKIADTIAGKLGEYAFMKFCSNHGLLIKIDFDITKGKLNIDNGQDISLENNRILKTKFDIKESKKNAQWLLIESHKINENIISADVYILVKVDLPKDIESNLNAFNINEINAEISGYALKSDFFDSSGFPWFRYKHSMSPLKIKFVDAICYKAIQDKADKTQLSKKDLITAYKGIKDNFYPTDQFLNMTQKAELNFGLPASKLRKKDEELDLLFKMIEEDRRYESSHSILQCT